MNTMKTKFIKNAKLGCFGFGIVLGLCNKELMEKYDYVMKYFYNYELSFYTNIRIIFWYFILNIATTLMKIKNRVC